MFTWICPKCGREVPPAYDECPDCAKMSLAGGAPPAAGAVAPPQQSMPPAPPPGPRGARRPLWATGPQEPLPPPPLDTAPPQSPGPPPTAELPPEAPPTFALNQPSSPMFQPAMPQAPQYVVGQPRGMRLPTWLLTVLFAIGFALLGGAAYWLFNGHQKSATVVVNPDAKGAPAENPLDKYIEVTGVRFLPMDKGKGIQLSFVIVNHSDSDIIGLIGTATIRARTQKAEEEPVGTVPFQLSMPAQSSKELTLPLTTKLKMVDMPDWQNVVTSVKITSPPGA